MVKIIQEKIPSPDGLPKPDCPPLLDALNAADRRLRLERLSANLAMAGALCKAWNLGVQTIIFTPKWGPNTSGDRAPGTDDYTTKWSAKRA